MCALIRSDCVIKWALAISAPAFSTTRSAHIGLALGLTLAPALAANLATAAAAIATTLGNTGRLPISGCGLVRDTSTTLRTRLLPRRLRALGRLLTLSTLGSLFTLRALGRLFTLRPLGRLLTLGTLRSLLTLRALRRLFTLGTLGRLLTLRALGRLFTLRTNALAVAFLTPWLRLTRLSLFTRAAGS
jgi:hypothetical protein